MLGCFVVLSAGCPGEREERPPARPAARAVPAHELLERPPYLGVSCRRPNGVLCDRVGLAVWLRRPALRVDAEIDGRRFALDDPKWSGAARRGRRRAFAGFLEPAGLTSRDGALAVRVRDGRWEGDPPVSAPVRLWVTVAPDRVQGTGLPVELHAGWG